MSDMAWSVITLVVLACAAAAMLGGLQHTALFLAGTSLGLAVRWAA